MLQSIQRESNSLLKHTAALLKVGALGMCLSEQGFYLRQLRQQGVSACIQLSNGTPNHLQPALHPLHFPHCADKYWSEDWDLRGPVFSDPDLSFQSAGC